MTSPAQPFGDRAFLLGVADVGSARALAGEVEHAVRAGTAPAGIVEVLAGFDSVVVRTDLAAATDDGLASWLADLSSLLAGGRAPAMGTSERTEGDEAGRTVTIPVVFDGPDLEAVADAIGAAPPAVVDLLTGAPLEVALLGFAPGFPYLVGLPPALVAIPRRATPRASVPAGSVAIGGGFASVYPQSSPGGWKILGHTSICLFDPHRPPFALLQPGDRVRFTGGSGAGATAPGGDAAGPGPATSG
ncbi:MAG: 5-oxoprolinase subunit B family protein, partial [Acidimicrobiales bacterium]